MTEVTAYARLSAGELDAAFAEDGKRKNRTDIRPTTQMNIRMVEYGRATVRMQDNVKSSTYQVHLTPGHPRLTKWYWAYNDVRFSDLTTCWNKPLDVTHISTQGDIVFYLGIPLFMSGRSKYIMPALKRCGIEQVRLMTFGEPFLGDADRLAFHSELL